MNKDKQPADEKPKACKDCKNPNCPKCGTTHGIWECIKGKDEVITKGGSKDGRTESY